MLFVELSAQLEHRREADFFALARPRSTFCFRMMEPESAKDSGRFLARYPIHKQYRLKGGNSWR